MKSRRTARKVSRQLLRHSFTEGRLDQEKVSQMVHTILAAKSRHSVDILKDYHRLVRLEVEKRHAVIESAAPLNTALADSVVANLRSKYGPDLSTEFRVNPELLGGLRIRIGNDVWDGSIRDRLQRLSERI